MDKYYNIDNSDYYFNNSCPDFIKPRQQCVVCLNLVNYDMIKNNTCHSCYKKKTQSNKDKLKELGINVYS